MSKLIDIERRKKFDLIIGNLPYSKKVNGVHVNLWKKILNISLGLLKPSGTMGMIHPGNWRGGGTTVQKLFKCLTKEHQMHYLEMHNIADGKKAFNADTSFDWYILENVEQHTTTRVIDNDGVETIIDFNDRKFLASAMIDEIDGLVVTS